MSCIGGEDSCLSFWNKLIMGERYDFKREDIEFTNNRLYDNKYP
jgi:hypothetical protein